MIKAYLIRPYFPWKSEVNQNFNDLTKGTYLNELSDQEVNFVVNQLNHHLIKPEVVIH
ncbi:transposase [Xenorhabdus sp. PB62.4]|nr:transposase [Xenorhabdus sp. PB62.4]